MIRAGRIVIGPVPGKLLKPPHVMQEADGLGDRLLALAELQSLGQGPDLRLGAEAVVVLELQVPVDERIAALDTGHVSIKPRSQGV